MQPCWPHGGPRGEHVSTAPQAGHGSSSLSLQVGAAGGVVIGGAAAARSSPLLLVAVGPLMTAQGLGWSREEGNAPLGFFSRVWLTSTLHERSYRSAVTRSPVTEAVVGCRRQVILAVTRVVGKYTDRVFWCKFRDLRRSYVPIAYVICEASGS